MPDEPAKQEGRSRPHGIGVVLREARKRRGLEIADVEQATKIRTRYLRALEDEDWGALPDRTYARAFLRTYADELGLDADALLDALRRSERAIPDLGERTSAGNGETGPNPWLLAGAAALAVVVVLAVFGLTGGSDDGQPGGGKRRAGAGRQRDREREAKPAGNEPVKLTIAALSDARLCALRDGRPVIDDQFVSAGTTEDLGEGEKFVIDIAVGTARLRARGGQDAKLRADAVAGPRSYAISARRAREIPYTGEECP